VVLAVSPKTARFAPAVACSPIPEPLCVTATQSLARLHTNDDGPSPSACGDGVVPLISALRVFPPTFPLLTCELSSLRTWSLSWSEATKAVADLPPNVSASPALRVHFGLGKVTKADRIEIRWPSGQVDALKNVESN